MPHSKNAAAHYDRRFRDSLGLSVVVFRTPEIFPILPVEKIFRQLTTFSISVALS